MNTGKLGLSRSRFWGVIAAAMLVLLSPAYGVEFDEVSVAINDLSLELELAHTFEQRAHGMMYRKSLCAMCGMLFVFEPEVQASMWMKNTFIPLDVAFIDNQGIITDIKPLYPHDLTSVGASKVVKYALEMNIGWFAQHGVSVGDQLTVNP